MALKLPPVIARTRYEQPQEPVDVDWSNPITQGLVAVALPTSGTPTARGLGGVISTTLTVAQSDQLVSVGTIFALLYYPNSITAASFTGCLGISQVTSFPTDFDQAALAYDTTPPARVLVSRKNSNAAPNMGRSAPTNEFRFTALRYKAGVIGDGGSMYETGQAAAAISQQGTLGDWLTGKQRTLDSGNTGGPLSLIHGVFNRTLTDQEIASLDDNPWQLFMPRRIIFPFTAANADNLLGQACL